MCPLFFSRIVGVDLAPLSRGWAGTSMEKGVPTFFLWCFIRVVGGSAPPASDIAMEVSYEVLGCMSPAVLPSFLCGCRRRMYACIRPSTVKPKMSHNFDFDLCISGWCSSQYREPSHSHFLPVDYRCVVQRLPVIYLLPAILPTTSKTPAAFTPTKYSEKSISSGETLVNLLRVK